MALEIGAGLKHMHDNIFTHTDLSARNCLVSSDLSVKLGDYGTGVEKYPRDYYVVGDRALPIRWSAPESLECSETTIETREITPNANIWSYAVLLWEIISWGERPYDELDDEQVIQILLSKHELKSTCLQLLPQRFEKCSSRILEVIQSCLVVDISKRISLEQASQILLKEHLRAEDFEHRWENSRPNASKSSARSASLKDLRGSLDSEDWPILKEEKLLFKHQAKFRLGPQEFVENIPDSNLVPFHESDSETEEESWRVKVQCGAYTEKVKQKSKSVTDLMILVHIDSDSDADWSLGPQITEKSKTKRLTFFGSDGDLRSKSLANEFDQRLKKTRDTPNTSILRKLSADRENTPVLKLSCHTDDENPSNSELNKNVNITEIEKNILRLPLEFEPSPPVLNCEPNHSSTINSSDEILKSLNKSTTSNNVSVDTNLPASNVNQDQSEAASIHLSNASQANSIHQISNRENSEISNNINDVINSGNVIPETKQYPSVEKEEILSKTLNNAEEYANAEQLRILSELDSFLDAECDRSMNDSLDYINTPTTSKTFCENKNLDLKCSEKISFCNLVGVGINELGINNDFYNHDHEAPSKDREENRIKETLVERALNDATGANLNTKADGTPKKDKIENGNSTSGVNKDHWTLKTDENDEDSPTVSLHSDNSHISFSLDEEFVVAIRNELREKLPHTQMSVIELPELRDEHKTSISSEKYGNQWDDDDHDDDNDDVDVDFQNLSNRASGVDIAIRYNMYDTSLSPIFEERESTVNSESVILEDESKDTSIASKDSVPDEGLFLMGTNKSKVKLVENTKEESLQASNDVLENEVIDEFKISPHYMYGEIAKTGEGVLLPSPEEESSKWQQYPRSLGLLLPIQLQIQGDLMSTSFVVENDWDSQEDGGDIGEEEDENDDDVADIDDQGDDEETSSSSGEFVYKVSIFLIIWSGKSLLLRPQIRF